MKIAIIGAGNVGKALAGSATKAGHQVTIASRHQEHAHEAAEATKAHAAKTPHEAVKGADMVVLAVPADQADSVVAALAPELDGKVIVDVTNRFNPKDPAQNLDGSSKAEQLQKTVPKAHVVKAFNYAFAARMANPQIDGTNLDGFVAGDDEQAKQKALEFAESIGFRPIDAGPLSMARALEAMGLLHMILQIQNNWPWKSGWKVVGEK